MGKEGLIEILYCEETRGIPTSPHERIRFFSE
jgi:hypothetical protein